MISGVHGPEPLYTLFTVQLLVLETLRIIPDIVLIGTKG